MLPNRGRSELSRHAPLQDLEKLQARTVLGLSSIPLPDYLLQFCEGEVAAPLAV